MKGLQQLIVPGRQIIGDRLTPGHDHRHKIDDLSFGGAEHPDRHPNDAAMDAGSIGHCAAW